MIEHARRGRRGWASGEKARPTGAPQPRPKVVIWGYVRPRNGPSLELWEQAGEQLPSTPTKFRGSNIPPSRDTLARPKCRSARHLK